MDELEAVQQEIVMLQGLMEEAAQHAACPAAALQRGGSGLAGMRCKPSAQLGAGGSY